MVFKLILTFTLLALFFPGFTFAHQVDNKITIHIEDNGFSPGEVIINQGDIVVFENTGKELHWPASDIHPTHQIYPEFDLKKPINPSEVWEFKFDRAGEWRMHDHLYPQITGKIIVKGDVGDPLKEPESISQSTIFSKVADSVKNIFGKLFTRFAKNQNSPKSTSSNFYQPENYQIWEVYQSLETDCSSGDLNCFEEHLKQINKKFGPKASLAALGFLQSNKLVDLSVDDHQLAHRIGRETAKAFGVNAQSFLLCPTTFNYGCQHGFFEQALSESDNPKDAAEKICESFDSSYPSKFKFYCYHGVGHGILMAEANDLYSALDTCDSLGNQTGQAGCWQGSFMENVSAGMKGEAREGVFSEEDPLAPCNAVDEKYTHECFINHAGWLMKFFGNDVYKASRACLKAIDSGKSACLQSIGLMVSNPSWQPNLVKNSSSHDNIVIAWELCQEFPQDYLEECVVGAVDNILNFDELKIDRAKRFCNTINSEYQDICYQKIGTNLRSQTNNNTVILEECENLGNQHKQECLKGAGIQ